MFLVSLKDVTPNNNSADEQADAEKPLLNSVDDLQSVKKGSDSSWLSIAESEQLSCIPAQRRRSRAVLYNLSGHIQGKTLGSSRINSCNSISSMFSGNGRQVLEYEATLTNNKSRFIFLHYTIAKTVWDWLIFIFTMYVAAIVPYYAALQALEPKQHQPNEAEDHVHYVTYSFDIFLEFVFILDIVLNFRTTYVDKRSQLVTNPKKIALNYIKSTFFIDLIAAVPFDFISHVFAATWNSARIPVQMMKTVRLIRVLKLYKKIDNWSQYRVVVLFMLMFMFGMVAHWMACIWFSIGWTEFNETQEGMTDGTGWIFELSEAMHRPFFANKTGGPDVRSAYLTSLYFTLSSLTSVGFGNVSANTNAEKMFSICVMIVGAIMHAVVFGSITAIIQRMYEKRSEYDRKERNLKDFMRVHRFPKDLKRRVIDTFQGKWAMNKGVNETEIVSEFPEDLQADMSKHLHRDLLNLPIFKETSEGCRRFAALHTSHRFVCASTTFLHAGDPLEYVFLVCSGSLEVSKNDIVSAILSKGDLFGGDLGNEKVVTSRANVKALTFCELQCISLHGLKKITKIYPEQCDIMDDMRTDFSCQLWEDTLLDVEELEKRRTTKIENWNKHYNSDEQSEESDTSCVYYPAVTVNTTAPKEDENSSEKKRTTMETISEQKTGKDSNYVNTAETLRSRAVEKSTILKTCPRPLKKKVSFNDESVTGESAEELDYGKKRFSNTLTALDEIPGGEPQEMAQSSLDEIFSRGPESPFSTHDIAFIEKILPRNIFPSPDKEEKDYEYQTRETTPRVVDLEANRRILSQIVKESSESVGYIAKPYLSRSPSSSTSNEIRKRRRRRKFSPKCDPKERTTSSSSLEEVAPNVTKSEQRRGRLRKISAVNFHASSDCQSPDKEPRLRRLEEKLDKFQIMFSSMAASVDQILMKVQKLTSFSAQDQNRPWNQNTQQERQCEAICCRRRSFSSQDLTGAKFKNLSPDNRCSSWDNVPRRNGNFEGDFAKNMLETQFPSPKEPRAVYPNRFKERNTSAVETPTYHPFVSFNNPNSARVSLDSASPRLNGTHALLGPRYTERYEKIDNAQNFFQFQMQREPFQPFPARPRSSCSSTGSSNAVDRDCRADLLSVPGRMTPEKVFHHDIAFNNYQNSQGNSSGMMHVLQTEVVPNNLNYQIEERNHVQKPHAPRHRSVPTIAVSNYDENINHEHSGAPISINPATRSMSFLTIPLNPGGSESGYSTASPSPDGHMLYA